MDLNQNLKEEKEFYNNQSSKNKTLYIVNFTPIRLLVFSISSSILVLFIFVLGFRLGGLKPLQTNNDYNNSLDLLMRDQNMYNENNKIPNNDITVLGEFNNNSIIREGTSSEDRYNEYTKSLFSELDAINNDIKNKENTLQNLNTTYTPPQQFSTISPTTKNEVTKIPYTRSSTTNSVYYIQVAVGYDREKTYSVKDSLRGKFPKIFIKEDTMEDGVIMYKLKIGRYENRDEALKALDQIRKIPAYKDSYIYSDKKII